MYFFKLLPLFLLLLVRLAHADQQLTRDDLSTIRAHFIEDIHLQQAATLPDLIPVQNSFDPAFGSFKDLDYVDPNNAHWGPVIHLARLENLALAYTLPDHPLYHSVKTLSIIAKGLDFWGVHMFLNYNWWMNEIGAPLQAYKILLLVGDQLSTDERAILVKITQRAEHRTDNSAQNTVWYDEAVAGLGAATNDLELIRESVQEMAATLNYTSAQGLHVDQSFWQHQAVFYNAGYGANFSLGLSRFAMLMSGTSLAFTSEQLEHLTQFILDGQLWLVRGKNYNFSSAGRSFARPGFNAISLAMTCGEMSLFESAEQAEFKTCEKNIRAGVPTSKLGNKQYWHSDFMIEQSPAFSVSVKMFSTRVANGDTTPNKEGYFNDYLSDGLTYVSKIGEEYQVIFPIWDFTLVPGTTETDIPLKAKTDVRYYGLSDFVGELSDATHGIAAMDFLRGSTFIPYKNDNRYVSTMTLDESKLSAKKSWFFSPRGYVALGAGIHFEATASENASMIPVNVRTSINQTWSRSDIVVASTEVRGVQKISSGEVTGSFKWFNHDDVAYLILDHGKITLKNDIQTGDWNHLNQMLSKDVIKGKVFSAWYNHGRAGEQHEMSGHGPDDSYAYAVFPGVKAVDSAILATHPLVHVLANTSELQSIWDEDSHLIQSVFFRPGSVSLNLAGKRLTLTSKNELIAQLALENSGYILTASNPRNGNMDAEFILNRKVKCESTSGVQSATCSFDRTNGKTTIKLHLPEGEYAGSSVSVGLRIVGRLNESAQLFKR